MEQHLRAALDNITKHGDTDVFPFPIENHIFFDKPGDALQILKDVHSGFEKTLTAYPPVNQGMLAAVGYTGFRSATQIDPLWNAYLLALALKIAPEIEAQRIPPEKGVVFSYRFKWDKESKSIFDKDFGWVRFQQRSLELAKLHKHILVCDISDFYPRIYHHRLENALRRASSDSESCNRIMEILKRFSKGVSYGLPVGGPAARLLSELLLNRVDRLLLASDIPFCRFADDYHVFASSAEEAYSRLVFLSEKLLENEGLLLQKHKTRMLSSEEFLATSELSEHNIPESDSEAQGRRFLGLRLHFDPYSATAKEDYEKLKGELSRFDIVGMLAREMSKSRINQALTRRLISAVQHLNKPVLNAAVLSMMDNLSVLYPVFPSVALLIRDAIDELDPTTKDAVFGKLRRLIREQSYVVMVPTNLAYAVRLLAHDRSEEADAVLVKIFNSSTNPVIRRDIILAMARRGADYWISDIRQTFITQTSWEKISTIISSYILGDEGHHWRQSLKDHFTPMQKLAASWAADKKGSGKWEIPT